MDLLKRKKVEVAFLQETHLLEKDVARMQNRFYHVIASSSNTKKNRGVIILAKRTFQYTDLGSGRDTEGRVAYIKTLINGFKIAFISVYAPNVFDAEFYNYLTNTILELSEFSLITGGDFKVAVGNNILA